MAKTFENSKDPLAGKSVESLDQDNIMGIPGQRVLSAKKPILVSAKKDAINTSVYFDRKLWKLLKRVAATNDTTITKILEKAAREYLYKHEGITSED